MAKRNISGGSKSHARGGGIKSSSGGLKRSTGGSKVGSRTTTVTRTRITSSKQSKPPGRKPPASSPSNRVTSRPQQSAARQRLVRQTARPARAVPPPPRRYGVAPAAAVATGGAIVANNVLSAQQSRQAEIDSIRHQFASLEASAQLSDIFQAIGHFDSRLTALPIELDEMRERGYVHAGQLEDQIAALDEKWDEVRPRVEAALKVQVQQLNQDMSVARGMLTRLNSHNQASISAAEGSVDALTQKIAASRRAVAGLYSGLDEQIDDIDEAMDRVDWMLDQFEAAGIVLRESEGPLAAAESEWHRDGSEGPEGMLMLTDQRLLFEQREKVATKKMLGLITTQSELVRELLLEIEVKHIEQFQDLEERSGFLGMGHDELLEMVLSSDAPVTRARFHLLDQDSAAWSALIQRVKTGAIDDDRAEDFLTEVEQADAIAAAFPKQCPFCMAAVPEAPRGVSSMVCEYCGSVITVEAPSSE